MLIRSALSCLTLLTLFTQTRATHADENWRLVWSDEFEEDGRPDPAKWGYERGFVRNRELQWYQPENAACRDGLLAITGRREVKPVDRSKLWGDFRRRKQADYTSASVTTRGKFAWQYGRLEVRAKIIAADGLWPAIWTLGVDGRWPANGEVDLMEFYDGKILANAAWRPPTERIEWDSSRTPVEELGKDWDQDFHVWRMDWDHDRLRLSVDDRVLNETDLKKVEFRGDRHPFRQPHYLILNLAIGGTQGGDPSHTEFPSEYLIDYARIYESAGDSSAAEADARIQ